MASTTIDMETEGDHPYSLSQKKKRANSKVVSDDDKEEKRTKLDETLSDDDQNDKGVKCNPGESAYDIRLRAMIREFFNNEFDSDVRFQRPEREIILRFGYEMYKSISSSETERLVAGLATQMKSGFKAISDRLEAVERKQTTVDSNKEEAVNVAKSYAAAVCKTASEAPDERKKMEKALEKATDNGCHVVMHPSNNGQSSKEQADGWIKYISEKQRKQNLRLNRVRTTKQNNVAIYFKDSKEKAKFMGSFEKEPIQGADIRSSDARKVSFAIRGVPANYDEAKLEGELIKYNDEHQYFKEEMLIIKDARKVRDGTKDDRRSKTFRIMSTIKNARLLLDDPYLHIAMRRFKVTLWKVNERCHKCLDKGHRGEDCRGRLVCKHCNGNHLSYNCDNRDPTAKKCAICLKLKKAYNHSADVDSCPTLETEALDAVNKTIAEIMMHHG